MYWPRQEGGSQESNQDGPGTATTEIDNLVRCELASEDGEELALGRESERERFREE